MTAIDRETTMWWELREEYKPRAKDRHHGGFLKTILAYGVEREPLLFSNVILFLK